MNRNWFISIVAAAALTVGGSVFAASIINSDHDLSGQNTNDNGQVCVYCHTPHNANQVVAPLWNRNATTSTFVMYNSPTMDMTQAAQPAGVSLACLGCHDGTIALDQIINTPNTSWTSNGVKMTGAAMLGTDLSNDHPISLTYDNSVDSAFQPPATVIGAGLPLFTSTNGTNQLECGSCHAVHDPAFYPFLRKSNASSALCLTCHIK